MFGCSLKRYKAYIQGEILELHERMSARGVPVSLVSGYEPDPYKQVITSMHVDSENNLWIQIGIFNTPVFRVYSLETEELLYTAAVNTLDNREDLEFSINRYGFAAIMNSSSAYPRVYIYETNY